MKSLRKLLFPFSVIYGFITSVRNYLYDKGVLKSYSYDLPIIAVGNLNVGGTGKTPQIEYLIRLLSSEYKIATLSRGYKRKTKGFVLADSDSDAQTLGDEPYQYFLKFPNITVAVDSDRKNGIEQLLLQNDKPEIILLDDAFQHRRVKAGLYILLTAYNDLFCDDYLLPAGNLRESKNGAKRADIIIVTKCPENLSEADQNKIRQKINLDIPVCFSCISYDRIAYSEKKSVSANELLSESKLIVAGIANPEPFIGYLKNDSDDVLKFPDHHSFSKQEIYEIKVKAKQRPIITTEKDYVRLIHSGLKDLLYYLPIESKFISGRDNFETAVLHYVQKYQ